MTLHHRAWAGIVGVMAVGVSSVGCAHGGAHQPMGHIEVTRMEAPEDAPENAKTVQVEYIFDRDIVNKDFTATFRDALDKKGLAVKESLTAKSHFDVKDAKITGTVTYVKKGLGHYSILEADLVATGHYDADVRVDADVQMKGDAKKASDDDWENTIIGGKPIEIVKNVMPTNIPIVGPLFLHAHFDLTASCALGVEGSMHATTGIGIAGDVHLAAKYKKAGFEKADGKKSKFAFEAKAPNFELAPRPYLKVDARQAHLNGRCSLQPTAVLLLEKSVGAKLSVEPYIEVDATRAAGRRGEWQLAGQAGVSVNAATDIQFFGHHLRKPKEFTLFDIPLTKPGELLDTPPARATVASHVPVPSTEGETSAPAAEPDVAPRKKGGLLGLLGKKKKKHH
jgi:hypothetical protein